MLQSSNSGANALGNLGSSLGYGGITQSLAVEFDTYKSSGDINNNHIAVLRNGNVVNSLAQVNASLDLNNGSPRNVWIDYDGSIDKLQIFLSGSTTKPVNSLLTYTIDLDSVVGSSTFVGFSAGTGSKTNAHDIENWEFTTSSPADTAPPTASLSAANITEKITDYTFRVNYSDATAVNVATIDNSDVRVTGPDGFSQLATLASVDSSNGSSRTAIYRIDASDGTWNAADNGIYTVELQPNQVSDTSGNFIPTSTLGSFQVDIAFNPGTIALSNLPIVISESDGTAQITVVRTGGSDGIASIDYTTVDNTATAGEDYTTTAGTLTFIDGETSQTITVPILSDGLPEDTETFNVAIDNAVGATLGTKRTVLVSVADSDADQLTLAFNQPEINVGEGDSTVALTVSLSGKKIQRLSRLTMQPAMVQPQPEMITQLRQER